MLTAAHSGNAVDSAVRHLTGLSDLELYRRMQAIYEIPSLAAWRAAELKVLRHAAFERPLLEIGCGSGLFSSVLFHSVDHGIDLSTKEVAICRERSRVHHSVSCMDATRLGFPSGTFASVFANCVIEHIPRLDKVLSEARRVLRPGGAMIVTVPLRAMEKQLLIPSAMYARKRAADLQHVNLLSEPEWRQAFSSAGFHTIRTQPYLSGRLCRRWDRVDGPLCFGFGRFTAGNLYRYTKRVLPSALRAQIDAGWQRYFVDALAADPADGTAAILVEAYA
jgi:SAM-dependent methyltransferase